MPSRLAAIVALLLAVALVAGCGSSTEESSTATSAPVGASAESCETFAADAEALQATGIRCEQARQVMYGWQRQPSCALPAAASRGSCRVRSYSCQALRADRGLAVSCARPGESLAFLARQP